MGETTPCWQDKVGEFGDKFRKAREKKDISLDDVSNVTKISSRMLRAIEEEHFDQLPGGVFNKGFIRAYAKHLGLDAEEAVTDYLACLRQAQIDAHEVWEPEPVARPAAPARVAAPQKSVLVEPAKPAVKTHAPVQVEELPDLQLPRAEHVRRPQKDFAGSSTPDIPWRIIAVAAVVVVLAAILWIRHSHRTRTAAAPPAQQTIPAPIATAPQPASASIATPPSKPAPAITASAPTPKPQPPQITRPAAAVSTPSSPAVTESNDVTTRTFGKPATAPPAKSAASLSLVIRAQETSWISVQADGQQVSQETLIAPAHASIRASREIVARVGNAAGVTFVFNGQEIPANGAEAEVKTFVFDANGMRVGPTAPLPTPDH